MKQCAAVLSDQRIKAAKALSALIQNQLASLGMPDAVFRIDVQPSGKYMANGTDNVALLFPPIVERRRSRSRKWLPAVNCLALPLLSKR